MILTEDFVEKHASYMARTFFKLAKTLDYAIECSDNETGTLLKGFTLHSHTGATYTCPAGAQFLDSLTATLQFIVDFDRPQSKDEASPTILQRLETLETKVKMLEEAGATAAQPEAEPKEDTFEQIAVEFDALELTQAQKIFLTNLRTRAKEFGCDIICTDKIPPSTPVRGDNRNKQFNCVYIRPAFVPAIKKGYMVKLSADGAYRSRWPHWKSSPKQMSGWMFDLPKDLVILESFIIKDERRCGVEPK